MSLSIITPHFNDLVGLKQIHTSLLNQTNPDWEWVVVDDFSNEDVREEMIHYFKGLSDSRIRLLLNAEKNNGSLCRNMGANEAQYDHILFLDSDDVITADFVANRQVGIVTDFTVFRNFGLMDSNGAVHNSLKVEGKYLDHYLNAHFIWQTTTVLWNKVFFSSIGQFHPTLTRLQDVELMIRALQKSSSYKVLDNPVDFYYVVRPIRERKGILTPVCASVSYLITDVFDDYALSVSQKHLVRAYYYLCVKYLERSGNKHDMNTVIPVLKLFYKKGYFGVGDYLLGYCILLLYRYSWLSPQLFLKLNRYFFKSKVSN